MADVLDVLTDCTLDCIDLKTAFNQTTSTRDVIRQLKIGILLSGVLCTCDSVVARALLVSELRARFTCSFLYMYTAALQTEAELQNTNTTCLNTHRMHVDKV